MTDNHNTPTTNHEQEHTMNDHDDIIRPLDLDGDLTELLSELGRALAIRTEKPSEVEWIDTITRAAASHPDPFIRAGLTRRATLRQLRHLVRDRHLGVRTMAATSPLVIDLGVQLAIAEDTEASVIHAMLDTCDPYMEVAQRLIACPHPSVRARLAASRIAVRLLERLTHDSDDEVRELAVAGLARYRRVTGGT